MGCGQGRGGGDNSGHPFQIKPQKLFRKNGATKSYPFNFPRQPLYFWLVSLQTNEAFIALMLEIG